jgi:hypothetical protein
MYDAGKVLDAKVFNNKDIEIEVKQVAEVDKK